MTRNRATIAYIARIEASRDIVSQAAAEGAALRGEFGINAQLLAMSEQYKELRAAGRLDEAWAVRARAIEINDAAKQEATE